jgi:hypothetical protein
MNKKTLICSLAVTLFSITGEMSFAQSAPAQTSETTALRSSRVRNPESIKRAKLTRLKKDVGPDEQQIQAITPIIDSYVESVQNVKLSMTLRLILGRVARNCRSSGGTTTRISTLD